jgi:hypothetical protein
MEPTLRASYNGSFPASRSDATKPNLTFVVTATRDGDALLCKMKGAIDETVQTVLDAQLTPDVRRCVLDMRDVEGINSWGSAKLLAVLRARPEISFSITACPWAFIDQLNMIEMMRNAFHVESVLYPLVCPSCSFWGTALLERAQFDDAAGALKARRCDKCGTVCDLAEEPSAFLAFYLQKRVD